MDYRVIGMEGSASFDEIVSYFLSVKSEVVLMDPNMVLGKDHIISSAMHAERSFAEGTNRSKTLMTEILLYAAWERQISKALSKMRPKNNTYVALLIDANDPIILPKGMVRNDSLIDATPDKAHALGLIDNGISYEEQAIENVAMVELLKF